MMPPSATVATGIVASLAVPPAGSGLSQTQWTAIIGAIQTMLHSATVTVPSAGLISPPGVSGGPVTGVAIGTIT